LTPGHIQCLDWLTRKYDEVYVGLLTKKAMKDYKEEIVPYIDREYILQRLYVFGDYQVVPQDSLDPSKNLKKYTCTHMASGDGWEPAEKAAAKKLKVKLITIKLPGEKKKKYSSSSILSA
jgi:glycerol-3-phosphate cytidylyltransferase-like family protein